MSNFVKLFLLSYVLFAFSCKKDDSVSPSDLVGTWNLSEATCNDGATTTTGGGQSFSATFTSSGKNFASTVTFKDDGTYTSAGTYTATLVTTILGQTTTQDVNIPSFAGSGTWSLNGTTLTVTDSQGTSSAAEVLENTDQKFRYKLSINEIDTSTPGYTVTQKGTYFFSLTK